VRVPQFFSKKGGANILDPSEDCEGTESSLRAPGGKKHRPLACDVLEKRVGKAKKSEKRPHKRLGVSCWRKWVKKVRGNRLQILN